jgi:hypothetical protein
MALSYHTVASVSYILRMKALLDRSGQNLVLNNRQKHTELTPNSFQFYFLQLLISDFLLRPSRRSRSLGRVDRHLLLDLQLVPSLSRVDGRGIELKPGISWRICDLYVLGLL